MKPPIKSFEPSAEALRIALEAFDVVLVSFDRELEKLDPKEFLPRYNRLRISLSCRAPHTERPVFLTIRRHDSKIGKENFYTVPFFPEPISVGEKVAYDLLSFDSFAVPFERITVEMCRPEDYEKRRVSAEHVSRAKSFATKIEYEG